ncbi:NACHT and WD repeat domain-containing protein 2-like [Centruroides sculpturatus]|uniref:NACHT and WD repeat domain-containing protein 2-like n=1 Tax=Centruroides sculpturatus TaxID=218467 RepID=UPI000C6CAA2B|nr:NACHT and WD repeat domain-containing protein 2-like [Centruroides sculpturatus]
MEEGGVDRLFAGCLDKLPPLGSKIVRIFTSSTFTDMSLERNMLMEQVYPKLKDYCRHKHGLEFQVVDMRWGVRDEATDDHMTTELCMKEIENCQRLSMGANFVVFLGQKYGYRPVPTFIDGKEFVLMRDMLVEVGSDVSLLDKWYKEDTNAVPSVYVLQPISSILPNFNNKRMPKLQAQDQGIWWDTLGKLQKLLRRAAQALFATEKMDKDTVHNYMMSVTEREVINGILKMPDTRNHCLAYIRKIENINMSNVKSAGKFVDLLNRGVDTEAQNLLADLRDNRLCSKMKRPNLIKFTVEWNGADGLDAEVHQEYLTQFLAHFHKYIIKLVDKAMRKAYLNAHAPIVTEILQHLHACNSAITIFEGRLSEIERVKSYVYNDSDQPLILHGMGGCGKTSLIAKIASMIYDWYPSNRKPFLILRFLGITPDSSCMISMLKSLCQQIAYNYSLPWEETPDDYVPLVAYLKRLLTYASAEQPLCIIIDSVDQLSGHNISNKVSWIPVILPIHVKMVVSTLSGEEFSDYQILVKMLENDKQFEEVKPLGIDLAVKVIHGLLKSVNRGLTASQWKVVKTALGKCSLPIFVKLVFAEIIRWRSYTKLEDVILSHTVMDSIMKLLERIEIQHGKALVSHALSYITASKSGVSEMELEDLLSLDDQVLEDVYQYHLPPVRRIPPLLWTRIRNDLPKYLSEREADGITVLNWYHKQFRKAAEERYFKNMNVLCYFHCRFADYFLGIWGDGKMKPFKYTDIQRLRFGISDKQGMADRKVPKQPMVFESKESRQVRYNFRKFGELPFHLLRAKMYDDLYKEILFNYKWLYHKLNSCQLQAVLIDFDDARENLEDSMTVREVILVADSLRLGSAVLSQYPNMIASQLISRLLPVKETHKHIKLLLEQCDKESPMQCALIPAYHCLHTPGGPMKYSLEGHQFAVFSFVLTSDFRYVVSVSNRFVVWDLSTADVSQDVDPEIEGMMIGVEVSPDDKFAVAYSNYNSVITLNLINGDTNKLKIEDQDENYIRGVSVSDRYFAMWSRNRWSIYSTNNCKKVASYDFTEERCALLNVKFIRENNYYLIITTSDDDDCDIILRSVVNGIKFKDLHLRGGLAFSSNYNSIFISCKENDNYVIMTYDKNENSWIFNRYIQKNVDKILALSLTPAEDYLIATMIDKFSVWKLDNKKYSKFFLPHGMRNIITKPLKSQNNLVLTKHNQYAVGGVRKQLYLWSVVSGQLLKALDAHFARVIDVRTVIDDFSNLVISSSIDRTVKVWNIDHIFEQSFCVDRMEMPINSISLSNDKNLAITVTRNSIGVWDVLTGKLQCKLADSPVGAIITHALITSDGCYVVCIESNFLLTWDLELKEIMNRHPESNVKQFFFGLRQTRIFLVIQETYGEAIIKCRSVPKAQLIYDITYTLSALRSAVITKDEQNLILSSLDKGRECFQIHDVKNGEYLYKILLKPDDLKNFEDMKIFPTKGCILALVGNEKGLFYDVKSKKTIRNIDRWHGAHTKKGKYGLYAPAGGGLEIIGLKSGSTIRVLLPRVMEGVFSIQADFTALDDYVYYYHSGKKTIRLFRVSDGKLIANYRLSADASCIAITSDGTSICVGGVDGSFITLVIVDPNEPDTFKRLEELPSRCYQSAISQGGITFKSAANLAIKLARTNQDNPFLK